MKSIFLVAACAFSFAAIAAEAGAATISLQTAEDFAVLGNSTVTNTGATVLSGDLGLYDGTAITGFFGTTENDGPGIVNGNIHQTDPTAMQAQADALSAYTTLEGMLSPQNLSGQDLGSLGMALTPGLYKFNSSANLNGTLTLDGPGEYLFQIGSTLISDPNSLVLFTNGASPFDVYWQVGSSTTLGTNSTFAGTILSFQDSTLNTGASLQGRVISLNGAVTLDNNLISIPEPSSLLLLGLAGLILFCRRHRTI